jgi:hypothetical protein
MTQRSPFRCFRTSPGIIRLAVMHCVRVPLSLRSVEDPLHERGIEVSHETVRLRWQRFGPVFAAEIRRRSVGGLRASRWRWHLDEALVKVTGCSTTSGARWTTRAGIVRGNCCGRLEERSVGLFPVLHLGLEPGNSGLVLRLRRGRAIEADPASFLWLCLPAAFRLVTALVPLVPVTARAVTRE